MKIAVMHAGRPGESLDALVAHARDLEQRGLAGLWLPHIMGFDAVGALSIVGRETRRIELMTAVVPTPPRHPVALAQQALTASAASGGRFALGIGLSHRVLIEGAFGLSYEKPARHMREYVEVLAPLLRGEPASFRGTVYRVEASLQVPGARAVPLLVAALGTLMLGVAGRLADGTLTWMVGARTLESHIVPKLRAAAREAGRPEPRVAAAFPLALTNDPQGAREKLGRGLQIYGTLPSYRAMLDREGVEGPADIAILGDEGTLRAEIERLRGIGVTDFGASIAAVDPGAAERTLAFLQTLL